MSRLSREWTLSYPIVGTDFEIMLYSTTGCPTGGVPKPADHLFSLIFRVESLQTTKKCGWSLHNKMHFSIPKACRLNFRNAKACRPNIFQSKAHFFNKFLEVPVKHIILFTSHVFPKQTNYTFNPTFIDPCLKVEQRLHLYGENCKACRLFF